MARDLSDRTPIMCTLPVRLFVCDHAVTLDIISLPALIELP